VRDLFLKLARLDGTVDRRTYALCGVIGFAIKYAIDSTIVRAFGHQWHLINYWYLAGAKLEPRAIFILLVVALPFIWFGVTMTILRARDAGASPFTVVLFFVPVANLIYFVTLMVRPSKPQDWKGPRAVSAERTKAIESALLAVLATTAFALAFAGIMTKVFERYGLVLFVGLPFFIGYASATVHAWRYPRSAPQTLLVAFTSLLFVGGALLAVAWEGVICLLMAAPIAATLTLLGALVGYAVQRNGRHAVASCVPLVVPLLMLIEPAVPPLTAVRTSIEIDAPAADVWNNVVAFSEITDAPEWFFRTGIAYPLRARMKGTGAGAIRYCIFTTGAFVEPIEVWDAPHRLAFRVAHNPAPMHELSPYASVRPPHLDGFLVSERGEFLLQQLPSGKTLLTGTTWYRNRLYPGAYWRIWTDAIIHRIHLRVLRHIRTLSERQHPQAA
jgi:hypothetical protein